MTLDPDAELSEEQALDLFRRAVHGLYLLSIPEHAHEYRGREGDAIMDPDDVGFALWKAPVDRLLKLHAVASALTREPGLAEHRVSLAQAVLRPDEEPERISVRAGQLQDYADRVRAREPAGLTPELWQQFLDAIGEDRSDPANQVVVAKPGCNDGETTPTPAGYAGTIRSNFWTNQPLARVARFIDPKNWVACGRPFWKEMTVVGGETAFSRHGVEGYRAKFKEVVDLPVLREVTVHLDVEYGRTSDFIYVRYELASEPAPGPDVSFDNGWLTATTNTHPPGTEVEGLKSIRFFDDRLNHWPDLACDGGWVYLMIDMALGCRDLPADTSMQAPGGEVRPPAAVGAIIDDWVAQMSESLQDHGEAAKSAIARMVGPRYDPGWINDLLGMGQGAVKSTKATAEAWRRVLEALATQGGSR